MGKIKKTYEVEERTAELIENMSAFFHMSEACVLEAAICQPQLLIIMELVYLKAKGDSK